MDKIEPYTVEELLGTLEPPSCEYRLRTNGDCADAAIWLLRLSCGDSMYLCDAHQAQMKAWMSGDEEHVHCRFHRELGPIGLDWMPV